MSLKDLREKFHDHDAKISALFHQDEDGVKKPSWGKIIPTWLGLIIVLSIVSSIAIPSAIVDVNEELTPAFSEYNLEFTSFESTTHYIYSESEGIPNKMANHISYEGKLKIELDTSNIPHNDYFEKVMKSYLNGDNEYNASVDIELIAFDANGNEINTTYFMGLDDNSLNIKQGVIDLLLLNGSKIDFKNGVLTIASMGNDQRITDSPFNSSLQNIDHIKGVVHVYNKNTIETSDPSFYNYTLNFTIVKNSINVKNS